VKTECKGIRDRIISTQNEIDLLKLEYNEYNNHLMLNKDEATSKAEIGHKLYELNIKAIHLIHDLALCQEGREIEHI